MLSRAANASDPKMWSSYVHVNATTKAEIPFAKTIRQDVQLTYTPHHNLRAEEYERYDRSYFATWNGRNHFNESKSIEDLPIDEEFGVILRIMVKRLGTDTSQEDVYITIDCKLEKLNTSLWFCKNKLFWEIKKYDTFVLAELLKLIE